MDREATVPGGKDNAQRPRSTSRGALGGFLPEVAAWFAGQFEAPSPAQRKAWPALRHGDNTLLLALKTASETVKNKIFGNLSARAVQMLQEDMEVMGPTKLSDVEKAQSQITQTALRLEAEGKLVIAKAGSEDKFV